MFLSDQTLPEEKKGVRCPGTRKSAEGLLAEPSHDQLD